MDNRTMSLLGGMGLGAGLYLMINAHKGGRGASEAGAFGQNRLSGAWNIEGAKSDNERLLLAMTGTGLVTYGFAEGFPWGCIAGTIGLGLMAAGLTEHSLSELWYGGQGNWRPEATRVQPEYFERMQRPRR